MAWTWHQASGALVSPTGAIVATGYSGLGKGKNNPAMQNVKGIGPIPRGEYVIGPVYDSNHTGPFTIMLTPKPENQMFGRSDFRIHGDSKTSPGRASHGCIILPRITREEIVASKDTVLIVGV